MGRSWVDGYSAEIEIWLLVCFEQFRISKIGPESFVLRDAIAIPPGTKAQLLMKIDDSEEIQDILLSEGASGTASPVMYVVEGAPIW